MLLPKYSRFYVKIILTNKIPNRSKIIVLSNIDHTLNLQFLYR